MTPYYNDEWSTIWHADCRAVLPALEAVDAVLADPPYGIGVGTKVVDRRSTLAKRSTGSYGDGTEYGSFEDTPENVRALMAEALPLCRAAAPIVAVTTGIGRMFDYPAPDWVLAWFSPGGTGSGPWGFTTWQPVLVYGACPYLRRGLGRRPDGVVAQYRRGVYANPKVAHPCPKPLRTMRWLVERVTTEPGQVVLDPFMGSGSTLEAARQLGRKAIGIEVEERYCEVAANRLVQGVLL